MSEPDTYHSQQIRHAYGLHLLGDVHRGGFDFDPAFDGFLDGRGTNTLVVTGVPVVLDYSRLSHHLITDILGAPELAPGVHHLRFATSADKTGLAEPAGSRLTLTADGRGHHPVATFS